MKSHEGACEVQLTGFSLPNLQAKTIVVKTDVKYDSERMAFEVLSKPIKLIDFATELQQVITTHLKVLSACRHIPLVRHYKKFILCLKSV